MKEVRKMNDKKNKPEKKTKEIDAQGKQKIPLTQRDVAAFCMALINSVLQDFVVDVERRQKEVKRLHKAPLSLLRGVDDLIRLLKVQAYLLDHLPRTCYLDIKERERAEEFIVKDPVAGELIRQLNRRQMHFLNTGQVMEVDDAPHLD
jgi:hypothetical protein